MEPHLAENTDISVRTSETLMSVLPYHYLTPDQTVDFLKPW